MRATRKFKDWFYGRAEIPSIVWYVLMAIGAVICITGIIMSSVITNH